MRSALISRMVILSINSPGGYGTEISLIDAPRRDVRSLAYLAKRLREPADREQREDDRLRAVATAEDVAQQHDGNRRPAHRDRPAARCSRSPIGTAGPFDAAPRRSSNRSFGARAGDSTGLRAGAGRRGSSATATRDWVLRHGRRGGFDRAFRARSLYVGRRVACARVRRVAVARDACRRAACRCRVPIAARYHARGLTYRCDLITRRIPDARPLSAGLRPRRCPRRLARRRRGDRATCIGRGVDHADLNAHNILLDAVAASASSTSTAAGFARGGGVETAQFAASAPLAREDRGRVRPCTSLQPTGRVCWKGTLPAATRAPASPFEAGHAPRLRTGDRLAVPLACGAGADARPAQPRLSRWFRRAIRLRAPPARVRRCLWLHAVSLGEVTAAAAIVRGLQRAPSVHADLVTTATPTGRARRAACSATARRALSAVRHAGSRRAIPA